MKKSTNSNVSQILSLFVLLSLFSCQSGGKKTGQGAAAGVVLGGIIGATQGGARGAAIGAAAGGIAGGSVGYYLDQRAKELSKVVKTTKTNDGLMITLKSDVLFDTGKADLKQPAKENLAELAKILKKYPGDRLRIAGYTDKVGTAVQNQQLSETRAGAVKGELVSGGIPSDRMIAVGMGETRATGADDKPQASDRKVEIYIDVEEPKK